jgi:cAMP phosphodiesterase
MMHELMELATMVDSGHPETALREVPVVVTSIKPSLQKGCMCNRIARQLQQKNDLGVRFIVPTQGESLLF